MKRKKRKKGNFAIVLFCTGVLWFAVAVFSWATNVSAQSFFQSYTKPQVVPDFSLQDLQGKKVDIRGHRGQVMLLNFWATW